MIPFCIVSLFMAFMLTEPCFTLESFIMPDLFCMALTAFTSSSCKRDLRVKTDQPIYIYIYIYIYEYCFTLYGVRGAVARSVERATPCEEWFDPRCGRPLPTTWQHVKLSDVSLGTRPQGIPVGDEDVKKPTNQTNVLCMLIC